MTNFIDLLTVPRFPKKKRPSESGEAGPSKKQTKVGAGLSTPACPRPRSSAQLVVRPVGQPVNPRPAAPSTGHGRGKQHTFRVPFSKVLVIIEKLSYAAEHDIFIPK